MEIDITFNRSIFDLYSWGKYLIFIFMSKSKSNKGLVASILFAAVAVSGSLVFMGLQMAGGGLGGDDLQAAISKGIDNYIAEQQKSYADQQQAERTPQAIEGDFTDDDAVRGDEDAPVTIVEFSDYQCPYCKRFHDETFPAIKSKYIDMGKVKFVYRDYPLGSHAGAYPAALVAECVRDQEGDDAYYKVHDELFEMLAVGNFDYEAMSAFASGLGVDGAELKDCFDSDKFKDEIAKDLADGTAAGISGTPGFIVAGMKISGAEDISVFEQIIDSALAQ